MDSVRSVQPVEAATGGAAPALDGPHNRDRFTPKPVAEPLREAQRRATLARFGISPDRSE
jgi:hypothetical protein